MKITVLGSGTSAGVPQIGCSCSVCRSSNPKNKRLRSSCFFEVNGKNILIDTSPDLREQCLRHHITNIDAVLFTHIHADHLHGIDEMRAFSEGKPAPVPVFAEEKTIAHLNKTFPYIFNPTSLYPSIVPRLQPFSVSGLFDCSGVEVQMVPCHHGEKYMTYNYRIGNAAWLTDVNKIPESSYPLLQNLDVLFLDGLRFKPHPTHFSLDEALIEAKKIAAKKTYLIHLTHDYDHDVFNQTLPSTVELAFDGLVVDVL